MIFLAKKRNTQILLSKINKNHFTNILIADPFAYSKFYKKIFFNIQSNKVQL